MPSAKEVLHKVMRIYRRIKSRSSSGSLSRKQRVCHKACNTTPEDLQRTERELKHRSIMGRPSRDNACKAVIIKTNAEISPQPTSETVTIITLQRNRMTGGGAINELPSSYCNEDDDNQINNGGRILENGMTKLAFCRHLDDLLQRNLGHTCQYNKECWPKSSSSYC